MTNMNYEYIPDFSAVYPSFVKILNDLPVVPGLL